MDESTLGVHQVELVVQTGPGFSNGGGVGQHADGAGDLGQITTWNHSWWLVVDSDLETGGAPVDELDGALGLDGGNGSVDVLGDDITTVKHATGHVFAVAGIAFNHLVGGFEAGVGDLSNGELLMVSFLGGDDRGVGDQREVDTGVWHQVGLELGQVDVEGTIETQRGRDRGDDLTDQTVQVGVGGAFDVQVATADVVDGFVVDHEGAVGVFQGGVGGQDRVVGLDDGSGDLGSWVDGEFQFGFLSVVDGQTFHQQGGESGTGASSERVEDQEALETGALVGKLADAVKHQIDDLLADGVVTTSVVVGSIFLAGDELFGVEESAVGSSADFIDDGWFQIDEDGAGNVLSGSGLREESVERIITTSD